MSRFRNAARSITSGYAALAANGIYLLASIPLALRYLSSDEFALWNLVVQIAGYLTLIDLGMTGAVSRILIDHKDDSGSGGYGSVIKTGTLVLIVQGFCIALGGGLLSLTLPSLLDVPVQFIRIFQILVLGQCLILGLFFVTRILMSMLQAHQRFDVINYAQILQLLAGFLVQWLTFHLGWGLYSLLAASAANALMGMAHNLGWVAGLKLFPSGASWGGASAKIFKEVFAFGKDLFLLSVGLQLLNASQVVIIARTMGLTAVTVWTIATKTFLLAQQVVARISDFSSSALGEMVVRGESERLKRRFGELLTLTGSVAVLVGAALALCNGSFLGVWLKGGTHRLTATEIKEPDSFAAKLSKQEEPLARFLWNELSPATRVGISAGESGKLLGTKLANDLNRIMQSNSIYQPERFAGVTFSEETKTLLGRELHGGWRARLNRLLIEDTFPVEIEKSIRFSSAWPRRNDILLGILLLVTSVTRCHIGLTGQTKQIGGMRFVYFLEGLSFVVAAFLVAPHWGMTGIIASAIVANILWSGIYGFWRTAEYFKIPVSEPLIEWLRPAYQYLLMLSPITALIASACSKLFVVPQFFISAVLLLLIGTPLLWLGGLNGPLRLELKQRFGLGGAR